MTTQTLIVSLLVAWAGVYAAWVLMPAPLKRGLLRLGQRHCPGLARRVAPPQGGCGGCGGGCDAPPPGAGRQPPAAQPIQLHLQRRR